ncbi:hypothetical protein Y032_0095g2816 [Ancylostoma ceylanicum]|nr:hypothetical protein Y032_0095g2816 [Ancylostoma ceylanicum]
MGLIFLFTICISAVMASSDCELSQWTVWSSCYGTCYFGQTVRNRDVIRPSLPDNPGQPTKRCPHLYETSFCTPESCKVASEVVNLPSQAGRLKSPVRVVLEKQLLRKGQMENEAVKVSPKAQVTIKDPMVVNAEAGGLSNGRNDRTRSHGQSTRTIEELSEQYRHLKNIHSFKGQIIAEGRPISRKNSSEAETRSSSSGWGSGFSIEIPKHLKPAKEIKGLETKEKRPFYDDDEDPVARESSINDVIRELESAADFRTHLDDDHIRKVLRRNRKLMRALVEAYKLRTTTSTTIAATTPLPDEFVTVAHSTAATIIHNLPIATLSTAKSVRPDFSTTQEQRTTVTEAPPATELSAATTESASSSESTGTATTPVERDESSTPASTSPLYQRDGDVGVSTEIAAESTISNEATTAAAQVSESSDSTTTDAPEEKTSIDMMFTLDDEDISTIMPSSVFIGSEEQKTSSTTPTTTTTTEAATSTTTTPPYWPRKGYVPNTRKHASEITSKLYMTQEIVQALSDDPIRRSPILRLDCMESKRCCKITRTECADGSVPKYVKRYYRPRGSDTCVPYHYPRCSQNEEMDEQPIQYEQNCQDLCFKGPEKRISPLFTLMDN